MVPRDVLEDSCQGAWQRDARVSITMLVTFSCPAYANITMFGDVAVSLLKLMGHSGTVPGALDEEDVEPALRRLEAALDARESPPQDAESSADGEDGEAVVSLSRRAWPLMQLLRAAAKAESHVMWTGSE